jgi:hypothetical protein
MWSASRVSCEARSAWTSARSLRPPPEHLQHDQILHGDEGHGGAADVPNRSPIEDLAMVRQHGHEDLDGDRTGSQRRDVAITDLPDELPIVSRESVASDDFEDPRQLEVGDENEDVQILRRPDVAMNRHGDRAGDSVANAGALQITRDGGGEAREVSEGGQGRDPSSDARRPRHRGPGPASDRPAGRPCHRGATPARRDERQGRDADTARRRGGPSPRPKERRAGSGRG